MKSKLFTMTSILIGVLTTSLANVSYASTPIDFSESGWADTTASNLSPTLAVVISLQLLVVFYGVYLVTNPRKKNEALKVKETN